jgi:hypothetical protein
VGQALPDVVVCVAKTPGLFGVALFEWGKRYLQTQQIGSPVFWSSGIATASSALLYWGLIHKAGICDPTPLLSLEPLKCLVDHRIFRSYTGSGGGQEGVRRGSGFIYFFSGVKHLTPLQSQFYHLPVRLTTMTGSAPYITP